MNGWKMKKWLIEKCENETIDYHGKSIVNNWQIVKDNVYNDIYRKHLLSCSNIKLI